MQSVSLDIANLLISDEKMLKSAEPKGRFTSSIYFLYLIRYNCLKFHNCSICGTDFKEGRPFCSFHIRGQPQNGPSWMELSNIKITKYFHYKPGFNGTFLKIIYLK